MKKFRLVAIIVVASLLMAAATAQVGEVVDRVAVIGDSSSGAVVTHVDPGEISEILVVSPFHHYRVPMDTVVPFPLAGDDDAIVNEVGTTGSIEVIAGPTKLDNSTWTITVRAPDVEGNWIASYRTVGISYEDKWGRTRSRSPRTVQLRLSTMPPIEEYVKGL